MKSTLPITTIHCTGFDSEYTRMDALRDLDTTIEEITALADKAPSQELIAPSPVSITLDDGQLFTLKFEPMTAESISVWLRQK